MNFLTINQEVSSAITSLFPVCSILVLVALWTAFILVVNAKTKKEEELNRQAKAGKAEPLFTVMEPFDVIKEKAAQGNREYLYRLAKCYERGERESRDYRKALELYAKASDLGHGPAAWKIAEYFDQGRIVPRNHDEKIRFIGIAAERNFPEAVKYVRAMTEPPTPSKAGGTLAAGIIGGLIGGVMAGD